MLADGRPSPGAFVLIPAEIKGAKQGGRGTKVRVYDH
jgi:hypothetical protein